MNDLIRSLIFFIIFLIPSFYSTSTLQAADLFLTEEESSWIAENPVIRVGHSSRFEPLFVKEPSGTITGILPDLYQLVASRLGVKFEYINDDWPEIHRRARSSEIDFVGLMSGPIAKKMGLLTTKPIYNHLVTVFAHKNRGFNILTDQDLSGLRVSYYKDIVFLNKYLENRSDQIELVKTTSPLEAMEMVLKGAADVMIGFNMNSHWLTKYNIREIEPIYVMKGLHVNTATAVRPDAPILASILQKGISSISPEERNNVLVKWSWIPEGVAKKNIFTKEEQAWLTAHPVIRVGADPDWRPIEFIGDDGNYKGFSIDLINRLAQSLGVRIEFVRENWQKLIVLAKKGQLDLFSSVAKTSVRDEYLLFTDVYIQMSAGFFAKEGVSYISDLNSLIDRKVAVVEGYAIHDYLSDEYPDLKLLLVKNPEEGLQSILDNDAFVYVDNVITTGHLITQKGYLQINMVGEAPFKFAQRMGVRKDWPMFRDILQKAINEIPAAERTALFNQWVPLIHEKPSDYSLFWKIGAGGFIFICFIVFWNRSLARRVRERTKLLETNKNSLESEIIERKSVEKELRESEERHRITLEALNEGLYDWDIQNNKLVISPSYYTMLGYEPFEFEPTMESFHKLLHPDDRKASNEALELILSGEKASESGIDIKLKTKDGSYRWINSKGRVVEKDSSGKPLRMVGTNKDITERKNAELMLERVLDKQNKLQRQLTDAMEIAQLCNWEYDIANDLFTFNDHFFKIIRTTAEAAGGYQMSSAEYAQRFVFPEDKDMIGEEIRKSIETTDKNFNGQLEHRILYEDGEIGLINVKYFIIKDTNGQSIKTFGVMQDITKQKQMEEKKIALEYELAQSQKMESIGNLAGGIAHDFNNILSSIIGFTELSLQETPKGSALEDNLQEVYSAGKRAKDLVNQILAFARQSEEKKVLIQPSMIAKEVLKLIRSAIPTTIEIKQKISSETLIFGSTTQIHQVLMNLCTNAAHAMEESGGVLEVNIFDVIIDKKDYIEIKVSDTGVGIAPEIIESIFEPYFTTKEPGEGTGIGLAMAQGVIESYGGKIDVESQLGKGTLFTIYIPAEKKRLPHDEHVVEQLPTGKESILFVDDEAPIAKMGSRILERLGYSVTTRTSSIEALELFQAKPNEFDIIVTDMTMPNMTGDELAVEMMKIRSDIPVILCTGYSKKISDEKASAIGLKAFVYKPVVMADLAKTVREVLDNKTN